ncbi:hypothetical protein GCM10010193_70080 [Kitasatospora atroaurantiaca]|uniref:Uncharacterized protein n=1 Tax=Kitasatospora atroaurantiaca TaxID=285545 RepID=A0A561ENA9_9ACTN|nr:hypothetical protein [Kitasatospora atroaurantiaca]TWE17094.1 hypothetical protein FB465_2099 [Kitasatospora atroaurantiaca]
MKIILDVPEYDWSGNGHPEDTDTECGICHDPIEGASVKLPWIRGGHVCADEGSTCLPAAVKYLESQGAGAWLYIAEGVAKAPHRHTAATIRAVIQNLAKAAASSPLGAEMTTTPLHLEPNACGTCRQHADNGRPASHPECVQRATLLPAPDAPGHEELGELTDEQKAALPARFHTPVWEGNATPNAWLCAVCWGDGWVTQWPCETAARHGAEVFTPEHHAEQARDRLAAELGRVRAELATVAGSSKASAASSPPAPGTGPPTPPTPGCGP